MLDHGGLRDYFTVCMNSCTSAAISLALVSKRKVSGVEYVNLRIRYVFAVAFRLAEIEREIVLAPEDQELWLGLL